MDTFVLVFLGILIVANEAKVFDFCELFETLKENKMHGYRGFSAADLVCASYFSSNYNTRYYKNARNVPYYGIFQLSGLEWCFNGRYYSANKCNINCDRFLDDDIKDDIACAKKAIDIKKGMRIWWHHKEYCNPAVVNTLFLRCTYRPHKGGGGSRLPLWEIKHILKTKKVFLCQECDDDDDDD